MMRPCSLFIRPLLFLLLLFCLCPSRALPAEEDAATPDPLQRIWSSRAEDMDALIAESARLSGQAEALERSLALNLQKARTDFSRLTSLYRASRGHPSEQLTLVEQMRTTLRALRTSIAPLENIAAAMQKGLDEVGLLENSLNDMPVAADESDQGLAAYRQSLAQARKKLTPPLVRVNNILSPARLSVSNFSAAIQETESGLIDGWLAYYLASSDNSLGALASTPALLADWLASLNTRLAFAHPQGGDEWSAAAKSFFLSALIMGIIGLAGLRGAANLPQRWHQAIVRILRGSWVWVGLGISILSAATNRNGGFYLAFVLLGALILIAGVAALSWRLRLAVADSLSGKASPLGRLYPPAAAGVIMLFSDLPIRVLGIAWGLVMASFLLLMALRKRRRPEDANLPLLERFLHSCAFWFGLASLLVALAGYARLAILVFMLLFALANTLTLANALNALFDLLADKSSSSRTRPLSNAVMRALAIPAAWMLSLICTLPWMWAVPGARYLAARALSANYTVGEASFDFSRLAAVAVLFFLARSLASLAQATLKQLPDRIPSMEQGVVPPLSNLTTYGIWTLFALLGLGLLGVNFTSLAVVAGGLSVGIGFGMQNIFNNLVSGLLLIFGRSILVGDYVEVAGSQGTVREISIRSTTLETAERALIYVPNSTFMSGQFTNWTRDSRIVRRSLVLGVAYGSDTDLVRRLLLEAAAAQDHILQFPAPSVFFSNFGASSLDFTMNVFVDDFDNAAQAMSELRFTVEGLFARHGVDIPYPQMTLHLPGRESAAEALPRAPDGGADANADADAKKNAGTKNDDI